MLEPVPLESLGLEIPLHGEHLGHAVGDRSTRGEDHTAAAIERLDVTHLEKHVEGPLAGRLGQARHPGHFRHVEEVLEVVRLVHEQPVHAQFLERQRRSFFSSAERPLSRNSRFSRGTEPRQAKVVVFLLRHGLAGVTPRRFLGTRFRPRRQCCARGASPAPSAAAHSSLWSPSDSSPREILKAGSSGGCGTLKRGTEAASVWPSRPVVSLTVPLPPHHRRPDSRASTLKIPYRSEWATRLKSPAVRCLDKSIGTHSERSNPNRATCGYLPWKHFRVGARSLSNSKLALTQKICAFCVK